MIMMLWMISGLILNYLMWWLPFSTLMCMAAAMFMILPALFKLEKNKMYDMMKNKKEIMLVSLLMNFMILPMLATILRYLFFWKTKMEILYWMLLLSIMPWWWLLTTYLKLTKSDLNLWMTLFGINLLTFWLYFMPFTALLDFVNFKNNNQTTYQKNLENKNQMDNFFWNHQTNKLLDNFMNTNNKLEQNQTHCVMEETSEKLWMNLSSCFSENWKINPLMWLYWFFMLVMFPTILLWIIKYLNLSSFFEKVAPIFSKIWTFGMITYIFSLEQMSEIFSSKLENMLLKMILLTLTFYIMTYILWYIMSNYLLKTSTSEKLALFWNITTSFMTLWLIIASVYAYYLNNFSMITIFVMSYFMQILLSMVYMKIFKTQNI